MLTCRELTELVSDYLEGCLSFEQQVRFQLHLGMCRHCRGYLRQMRATIEMLGGLGREVIPPQMPVEFLQRFRGWKR